MGFVAWVLLFAAMPGLFALLFISVLAFRLPGALLRLFIILPELFVTVLRLLAAFSKLSVFISLSVPMLRLFALAPLFAFIFMFILVLRLSIYVSPFMSMPMSKLFSLSVSPCTLVFRSSLLSFFAFFLSKISTPNLAAKKQKLDNTVGE